MIAPIEESPRVLVTGATGYVGGRLVPRLLESGYRVRVLVRDADRLQGRPWLDRVEVAQGDALRRETLVPALSGVWAAYYLIHSMLDSRDFHARDLQAAENFSRAAAAGGVSRLIYLGGLGDPEANLSPHLRSRQQTGRALRAAGVPTTEFRAAIIVGAGSASFEIVRYLVERLPLMICPRWVYSRVQPIAIEDVLEYLVCALRVPESAGWVLEIGGQDVMTYGEMMLGYARERGLQRRLFPVPVLTPKLSSYWVHWMSPIPAGIARPLIDGLRNDVVVRDDKARQIFPDLIPLDYATAVRRALEELEAGRVETTWSDSLFSTGGDRPPVVLAAEQGMIIERRQRIVKAPGQMVYYRFSRLGGARGWPYANWAWRLRGEIDRLVGGVGFRRGRRDPDDLRIGDALDFWRVEAVQPGRLIRLRAEMKVPGKAWLQFEAASTSEGATLLSQTAFFAPKGLAGLLYWYLLYPFHSLVFSGTIRKLAEEAEAVTTG